MAYTIIQPILGAQPIAETSTTKKHPLGTVVNATDETLGEGTFIYAKASAAVLQYDCVWVKGATQFAAKITDTLAKTPGDVAFAQIAFAADDYGWFQRNGSPTVRCKPGTDQNTALYVNASAGTLSTATLSNQVLGVVAVTTVTTTVGAVQCRASFPTVMRAASLTQI